MVEPHPVPHPKMCQCIRQNTTKSTIGISFNVSMLVDITILLHFTNIHPMPRLKALISYRQRSRNISTTNIPRH